MVNEIWGMAGRGGLAWPGSPAELITLLLSLALLALFFYRAHPIAGFRAMGRAQWALFIVLCGASLLLSQLFPLEIRWSNDLLREQPATSVMALLSAAPYLLAGVALNVPAAVVVGLFAGLGRALGQTGAPLDIVAVALAAGLSAQMLRQNYSGRLFAALRQPIVAGVLGRPVILLFGFIAYFTAAAPPADFYGLLDLALYISLWSGLPLLVEGAVGGAVASAVLWIAPQWRGDHGMVPSPFSRSLQRQLVAAFLSFAAVVVLLSALVAFHFSARSTERALAKQMVDNADATAARLGALQTELAATLTHHGADPGLAGTDAAVKSATLGRIQSTPLFSDIRLVSASGQVLAAPGANASSDMATLSPAERAVATDVLANGETRWVIEPAAAGDSAITLAVPGAPSGGQQSALLAVVDPAQLAGIAAGLTTAGGMSHGLIVDEASRVLLASRGASGGDWTAPAAGEVSVPLTEAAGRPIYQSIDSQTGARQLVSISPVTQSGWKVIAITPRAAVLRQTLGIIGPLALLLLAVSTLFYALVAALGRDITRPIAEIGQASKAIAEGGGLERPVRSQREDEIGQLTLAFSQMQRALRHRLDELSLLLSVSNDISATINIDEGMSAVLQGILRGTGAAGARAIVRNPHAPAPLVFAEGPAAESISGLDRMVLLLLRTADELALGSAAEIEEALEIPASPAAALFALPLRPAGEFQGVLYLTYRQPHYFDSNERNLLRTLAGQATVLVQNAHLFASAEGGRRRLAAILASTTNGVLVTDQTDRILLINPALERAFGVRARDAAGRPVVDVLGGAGKGGELAKRLSLGMSAATGQAADGKIEVEVNGHAFLGSISTVYSNEGQTMGRVAVLQDVTDLKELERLKSDFVAGISHDLLSPLTYMHNYTSMLPLVDDPALEREYLDKILGGIERMKRLVNDLLDLARIEAGLNLQIDRVDVRALLGEIALEYGSQAKANGVELVVETAENLPPATADPTLLRRAMTNLVTNGIKHAPMSGPLTMHAQANGRELVLSVHDRGPGIAAIDQVHLFEKFYRGQGMTTAERARGSGLGLAIVKSVAEQHGGRVWCESAPGQGSQFYLALPLRGPNLTAKT